MTQIGQSLAQSQTHQQLLTPAMQQSLRVLHASFDELREMIDEQLCENPTLEAEEGESTFEWANDRFTTARTPASSVEREGRDVAALPEGLSEHLLSQVSLRPISDRCRVLVCMLIQCLDVNGYLEISPDEACAVTGASKEEIAEALEQLRSLEPAGVGARTLTDCLLLQLTRSERDKGLEAKILSDHSALLSEGRIERIAAREGVSLAAVKSAVRCLQKLNPFPGAAFHHDQAQFITPDVLVKGSAGKYTVDLNESAMPRIKIGSYYRDVLEHAPEGPERRYIGKRLRAASWFLQCLLQRQETILKIAQCIANYESEFFDDGLDSFRPLYLREIAAQVGLHESTVSRAIANKYIQTPRGILEFKYFFTSRIRTSAGDVSSRLVKELIRKIVDGEDRTKPVSDYAIADMLKETHVSIARRTITKYREELGIPAAPRRKMQGMLCRRAR